MQLSDYRISSWKEGLDMQENLLDSLKGTWKKILLIILLLFITIMISIIVINKMSPIIVGFSAQLTGKQGELGVQERNGVQLAVETVNELGGIAGRKIQLIIKDDFGKLDKARDADTDLIKAGVVAIIGHATTSQTLAGLDVTNPAKVIMLSPTASTPELSGIDDYFFRIYPSFKESAQAFAQYIYENKRIKKMSLIYDSDNLAYAQVYSKTFSEKYYELGGEVVSETSFSSVSQPDFSGILTNIRNKDAQGLLIVASDADTALIAQRTKSIDWPVELFTSAWAQTKTLIDNGGQAVEAMMLEQSYLLTSEVPSFIDFKTRYQKRFGEDPSFGAAFAYEATLVLAEALKKTGGKSDGLKEALTQTKDFKGVVEHFSIDEFGDVERPFYLSSIIKGEYVIIGKLSSQH